LRETAEEPFVFWTENQLRGRFPSYYSPLQIANKKPENYPSPIKISLISGESSLVIVPVGRDTDVDSFITDLRHNPDVSAEQLTRGKLD